MSDVSAITAGDARNTVVEVSNISKRFGGVQALSNVTVAFDGGQVHALVGANGAGKSTLKNVIAGIVSPDIGSVRVSEKVVALRGPLDSLKLGIRSVQQELGLIPWMSVEDNLWLGSYPASRVRATIDHRSVRKRTREILSEFGLDDVQPQTLVGDLSIATQQLIEIARASAGDVRCLILDEPSAILVGPELDLVFEAVDRVRRQGAAVIYISHRLEEVFRLADIVTVLRNGEVVRTAATSEFDTDSLIRCMTGQSSSESAATKRGLVGGAVRLEVEGLCAGSRLQDISLEVRTGEIVGIAGLMGSGRSHLLKALFGTEPRDAGRVKVDGQMVPSGRVTEGLRLGIVLIPEDRKRTGLIISLPVERNLTLTRGVTPSRMGWIDRRREHVTALRLAQAVGLEGRLIDRASQLSGGNQQKIALMRWLSRDRSVVMLDEPTRGVDIAAKGEIHQLLYKVADGGSAVLVVSSDFEELLEICDRIAVVVDGRIVTWVDPTEASERELVEICSLTLGHP